MRTSSGFVLFGLALIAALVSAGPALSQAPTPQLSLVVDPLGEAFLSNDSSTDVRFHGYLITSKGKLLEPATWDSIQDPSRTKSAATLDTVAAELGQGALFFGQANPGPTALAALRHYVSRAYLAAVRINGRAIDMDALPWGEKPNVAKRPT